MNYQTWLAHLRANREDRPEPDWAAPFSLGGEKLRLLRKSLAEYQLGDGGGECYLVAADAESYRGVSDAARAVVDAWFAEEREHSRLLAPARAGGRAGRWGIRHQHPGLPALLRHSASARRAV